ncbi:MAG: PAS domain-containing protein [Chloroflexi bacterium]|nr:PAS domain-containing protein [Chloroflexota bacterium]
MLPLRVLIVDDSEQDAALLLRELKKAGYSPLHQQVDSAEEMDRALEGQDWDVILCDYIMPGFGGLQALELVKEKGLDLPFIVVSGKIGEDAAVALMRAGAHDCVQKDSLKRLVPVVRRELADAKNRRERAELERFGDLTSALVRLFWQSPSAEECFPKALALMSNWSRCRCIGIRWLDSDGNIPYLSYAGFSPEFIEQENPLSINRDQCACIRVIANRLEAQDAVTPGGSFCSSDMASFVGCLSTGEQSRYRHVCAQFGFKTVVIVPVRHNEKIMGAIHLADERPGLLSEPMVAAIESLSPLIGQGISHFQTEAALRRSQASLLEAQRIGHLGNWDWDAVRDRVTCSEEVYRIFGVNEGKPGVTHQDFLGSIHPDDRMAVQQAINEALHKGTAYSIDYRIVRRGGAERILHERGEVTLDASGRPLHLTGTVQDVTEQKRTEAELRSLSNRLVQAQEAERRDIARELHDQVGQQLTVLKLLFQKARQSLGEGLPPAIAEAEKLTGEILAEVRSLSLSLRPGVLDDLGLLPALEWYLSNFATRTKIRVDFRHAGMERQFDSDIGTAVYRIVQEALTNVVRHAGVDNVAVHIRADHAKMTLRIEDNGAGFDPAKVSFTSSGLRGIRERVQFLGGNLAISSAVGQGTRILVELPLPNNGGNTKQ